MTLYINDIEIPEGWLTTYKGVEAIAHRTSGGEWIASDEVAKILQFNDRDWLVVEHNGLIIEVKW